MIGEHRALGCADNWGCWCSHYRDSSEGVQCLT